MFMNNGSKQTKPTNQTTNQTKEKLNFQNVLKEW